MTKARLKAAKVQNEEWERQSMVPHCLMIHELQEPSVQKYAINEDGYVESIQEGDEWKFDNGHSVSLWDRLSPDGENKRLENLLYFDAGTKIKCTGCDLAEGLRQAFISHEKDDRLLSSILANPRTIEHFFKGLPEFSWGDMSSCYGTYGEYRTAQVWGFEQIPLERIYCLRSSDAVGVYSLCEKENKCGMLIMVPKAVCLITIDE